MVKRRGNYSDKYGYLCLLFQNVCIKERTNSFFPVDRPKSNRLDAQKTAERRDNLKLMQKHILVGRVFHLWQSQGCIDTNGGHYGLYYIAPLTSYEERNMELVSPTPPCFPTNIFYTPLDNMPIYAKCVKLMGWLVDVWSRFVPYIYVSRQRPHNLLALIAASKRKIQNGTS